MQLPHCYVWRTCMVGSDLHSQVVEDQFAPCQHHTFRRPKRGVFLKPREKKNTYMCILFFIPFFPSKKKKKKKKMLTGSLSTLHRINLRKNIMSHSKSPLSELNGFGRTISVILFFSNLPCLFGNSLSLCERPSPGPIAVSSWFLLCGLLSLH